MPLFGLVIRCELRSDASDEFDGVVKRLVAAIRKEPHGVAAFSCHRVTGLNHSRIIIELFPDHVAFLEFGQRPEVRTFEANRERLQAGPPRVDFVEDSVAGLPFVNYRNVPSTG